MRKWIKVLLWTVGVVVVLLAAVSLLAGPIAKGYVNKNGEKLTGRRISVEHVGVNLFSGNVCVRDLCVYEDDGKRAFASFEPAVFTSSLSTIFNNQFWVKEPEKYNGGDYYRFSSKVRLHLGVGSRLSLNIPNRQRRHFDRISFYYELSTYDLAIISAVPNEKLTLGDILCLGIGLQYKFF